MLIFLKILLVGILMFGYTSASLATNFWWNSNWNYRVSFTVNSGDYEWSERPVGVAIDFSNFVARTDILIPFDLNSIRIIEVDVTGENLISENVLFQFDPAADFDTFNNSLGTLVFLLNGNKTIKTNRYFQVYFGVEGDRYTAPPYSNQVNGIDNMTDEEKYSFLISTINEDYYYQKQVGGFSSIPDKDNNDWINYQASSAGFTGPSSYTRGTSNQDYSFSVIAKDANDNQSATGIVSGTTLLADAIAPNIPIRLTLNSVNANVISFSWSPEMDTQGALVVYHIMRNGKEIDTTSETSYTDDTVLVDTVYVYNVIAEDNSGNKSAISANLEVGSLAKTGTIATSSSAEVWIGASPGNTRYFDGLIDNVSISTIPKVSTPANVNTDGDRIRWSKLYSDKGNILPPGIHPHQVAALIFDINKDGINDFVIGSRFGSGPTVVWYERTTTDWIRHIIESDSSLPLEAGGTFHDIDGDGDNDLILGDGRTGQNIYWWENPYPNYGTNWVRRLIKAAGGNQHHDHIFGDFDNDGVDEFAYWVNRGHKLYLAEIPSDPKATTQPWHATEIANFYSGERPEGIDKADIDLDGTVDIVGAGHWFKLQPDGSFQTMIIDSSKRFTRTAVGQLIEGGRPEVVIDSGDDVGNLTLYEWNGLSWLPRDLLGEQSQFGHSLNIGDVDGDGHLDIFSAEMILQDNPNSQMRILYGDGAGGFTIAELDIGTEDHESKLGDLDGDGDIDILRKPFTDGAPGIEIWINEGPNPFAFWNRIVADNAVPWRTIFLEYGDIDQDGQLDLITGGWWWKNPGSISGNWERRTIGEPMNQIATVYDFDSDGDLDIIGTAAKGSQSNSNLYWAENDGSGKFTIHSNIGSATGDFLQGITVAQFIPGQLQIALSWHDKISGIELVNIPPAKTITTDQWNVSVINGATSLGEALDHGDIDNDGDLDILTGINWLRNDGSGNWSKITLFNPIEGEGDRNTLIDMDGDGDLDAVIGYGDTIGKLAWYEQPNNNPEQLWTEHLITNVDPSRVHSMSVADFDGDGDIDISIGEHQSPDPGGLKLLLFENAGNDIWLSHQVYTGDEHHDAAHMVDLDADGDLDIISIGWLHRNLLIYQNQTP